MAMTRLSNCAQLMRVCVEAEKSSPSPLVVGRPRRPRSGTAGPSWARARHGFISRDAPVDLSTLRVKDYATEKGLHIKDGNLPSGEHTVRVTLGDTEGGLTVTQLNVKIM